MDEFSAPPPPPLIYFVILHSLSGLTFSVYSFDISYKTTFPIYVSSSYYNFFASLIGLEAL